jgi:tetratricopeptide (TPR) repeat protein
MSRKKPPAVRPYGAKRMFIAGMLTLVSVTAAGLWLRGDVFAGREALVVRRALATGRLDEASQALERWLRSSPDSAAAHYFKARIAWLQNDFPAVDRELARARALGYDWQAVARLKGLLLARGNQTSEAEPLLRQALDSSRRLDPEVAEALTRLYLGTFRLGAAAAVLDRWMREVPDDARPYLLQTEIDTRNQAGPELIIARYRAALERDPSLDQARFGLAEQLLRSYRHAEAASEYAAYLARKPGDALGYVGAGQNALEMGDEAEATRLLDRALTLAPHDPEVLAARAALELHQGHPEAALRYFDRALKSDPFDYRNRYQRMLIVARLGRKAEANAERAALGHLADEQTHFGQISRDLLRNPLDAQLRSEAARWLMEHGHEDEAVEWANLVLRADPSHPAMNRLLADHYRKKGQLGLANFHEAHAAHPSDHAASAPQPTKPK